MRVIIDGSSWWERGYKQEKGDNEAFLLQPIALLYRSLPGVLNRREDVWFNSQAYHKWAIRSAFLTSVTLIEERSAAQLFREPGHTGVCDRIPENQWKWIRLRRAFVRSGHV